MNYLYLSNCLLCNAPLHDAGEGHIAFFYCSKDCDHFNYDLTNSVIQIKMDYGSFQFTLNGKDVSCAIFYDKDSGQRIWLSSGAEDDNTVNLALKPTFNNIKSIIEKFEIRRTFK